MAPKELLRQLPLLLTMTVMSACTATVESGPGRGVPSSCSLDSRVVGCVGAHGYSCTGVASPDDGQAGLSCSSGTASNGGLTLYCCVDTTTVASGCTADSTIVGCTGSSIGFSCAGAANPQQGDSSLVCSSGTPSGSATLFCCASFAPSTDTCAQDGSVTGCVSPSIGFSCTGTHTPSEINASLSCSAGTPGGAGAQYCCGPMATPTPTPTAMCAIDAAVTCAAPSAGYSCTGGVSPMQSDATLSCGQGMVEPDGTTSAFCCNSSTTPPKPACMADSSVMSCPAGADGYTCTGGMSPETMSLLCGPMMAGANGAASYCCTTG